MKKNRISLNRLVYRDRYLSQDQAPLFVNPQNPTWKLPSPESIRYHQPPTPPEGSLSIPYDGLLHGADYNPDQWLNAEGLVREEILKEDIRLMKKSGCNVMSVGIFAWATLEAEEGRYDFRWLRQVMDKLYENGIYTILATPSGARPHWLTDRYPETSRVDAFGRRHGKGGRHNHCYTSPLYREKVREMNSALAREFGGHPGLLLWHVSNEYSGDCHCPLCVAAFRDYLKQRYQRIEHLNAAWWTSFWSHNYQSFDQIDPPSPLGEMELHGLKLDWRRFQSAQTLDFFIEEIKPLRELTPKVPLTTNFHEFVDPLDGLDYWIFAPYIDVISWDNYPYWHGERKAKVEAARRAFIHDINYSLKRKPFLLMESSPGATNWQPVAKQRRPGMHALASMQAVAHGSNSVQYFQWRKGLGGSEKFHAAVVDHYPTENTRMFREIAGLGQDLSRLSPLHAADRPQAQVAIINDWDNLWALNDAEGPRRKGRDYFDTLVAHYQPFFDRGISCEVIDSRCDFSAYKLLIAPMLYLMKPGVATRMEEFVRAGGTLVTGYFSGVVNETDLCFTNGRPGPLKALVGLWSEELDALYDGESCPVKAEPDSGLKGPYEAHTFCEYTHLEGAKALALFDADYYKGCPALSENRFGLGKAYYIAFRSSDAFLDDFLGGLADQIGLKRAIQIPLPEALTAALREDGQNAYILLQNYGDSAQSLSLDRDYTDALSGEALKGEIVMPAYSYRVLQRPSHQI